MGRRDSRAARVFLIVVFALAGVLTVAGNLEAGPVPSVDSQETGSEPRVLGRLIEVPTPLGALEFAQAAIVRASGPARFYSGPGSAPLADRSADYQVVEVPVAGLEQSTTSTTWVSAPFSMAGWRQVAVLARARDSRGAVIALPASWLEVRNRADMPFARAGEMGSGLRVMATQGRAVLTTPEATEVLAFSIYLSR